MEKELYKNLDEVEKQHWWFVSRRSVISTMIKQLDLPEFPIILEAGCGTGGNLQMLSKFGKLYAIEIDDVARDLANKKNITKVDFGAMPDNITFENNSFDIVSLFDVLEHIEDDNKSLECLHKITKNKGYIILTVPAFQFLWSSHDEAHHHFRRYTRGEIVQKVKKAGFTPVYSSYYNFWLFPAVVIVRLFSKGFDFFINKKSKNITQLKIKPPPKAINTLLTKIFSSEKFFIKKKMKLPFGSSIILVAQKDSV